MNKVKIEVIKTHFDEELAREFGVDSACPMHKVGESFSRLVLISRKGFEMRRGRRFINMYLHSHIARRTMYFILKIGLKSQALP